MKNFKIKYNVDNNHYRLGKEIAIVKYDISLLDKAITYTTDFLQLKLSMIDTPYEFDRFEELLSEQTLSRNKKLDKLKELEKELDILLEEEGSIPINQYYYEVLRDAMKSIKSV